MLVGMTSGYLPQGAGAGDLVAELAAAAPRIGANSGLWPGLTIYRFTAPVGPTWEEIQSLSLCIVAQGRKAVTVDGQNFLYDPFHYLVLASHLHFQAEVLEASIGRPFLSFVLQIDPVLVRQVSSDMLERRTTAFRSREAGAQAVQPACVSALDSDLLKISSGKALSPILLLRGDDDHPLIVADGYHRVCASYWIDENTDIPCILV